MGKIPVFNFREITTLEAAKLISKLGSTTSSGHDEVDAMMVKIVAEHLVQPVKHLVNVSLMKNQFANRWKLSKIVPLLKGKKLNRLEPASYRPVALLPTLSKIVERAAQLQLLQFLENTGQLNSNAHAYRTGLSTTTTLMQITN